jgi:hypothetical protein
MNAWTAGLAAALLLGACSRPEEEGAERTPSEQLTVTADTSRGYRTGATAPVTPVQSNPLTATGQFQAVGGGAAPGSVTLAGKGEGTAVSISLIEGVAQGTVQASLVNGNCAAGGGEEVPIGELTVGATGTAGQTFTVNVPVRTVMDGTHSVRLSQQGKVMACAAVPRAGG